MVQLWPHQPELATDLQVELLGRQMTRKAGGISLLSKADHMNLPPWPQKSGMRADKVSP